MKTRLALAIGAVLLLVAVGVHFALNRERRLAVETARRAIVSALADSAAVGRDSLAARGAAESYSVVDVDLHERTWIVWFDSDGAGSAVVNVAARRGIAFVPLFNSDRSLRVANVEFVSP